MGRAHVEEIQRARLLAAMVGVVAEHGLADASVARVVARAGVSRRTFYELFDDREQCFLAALDETVARACGYVLGAYDPGASWVERIRMALTALLQFLEAERDAGLLLIVASLGAGAAAFERRRRVLERVIAAVDRDRDEGRSGSELPPLTAEGVVGGALSVVHARLLEPNPGRLTELAGPLTSMIVLPYLGPAAARREFERPAQMPLANAYRPGGDPLRDTGMRLTYRTVRVLMSVAAHSESSNREIGEAAGIADQGQISKLLGRLERLGLVENRGLAPGQGASNAWVLTAKGLRVEQVMRADTGRQSAVG